MFLAILPWKKDRSQTAVTLESLFTTITTAISYVRYTPGIKVI
jgi:hypothetical protein